MVSLRALERQLRRAYVAKYRPRRQARTYCLVHRRTRSARNERFMKKVLLLLPVLFGCGAEPGSMLDDPDALPTGGAESTVGVDQEALTYRDGYGILGGMLRCWTN